MIPFIILFLSLVGLWISIYFTGVFYKWFRPDVFWIPRICQLKEQSCMTVLDTPRAKLWGIPNSAFGMALYAYVILNFLIPFPSFIVLAALFFAVWRSVYLAHSLIFVTKIPCPLCFTTHVINISLFLLMFKTTFYS